MTLYFFRVAFPWLLLLWRSNQRLSLWILLGVGHYNVELYTIPMFLCSQNWLLSPTVDLAIQKAYKTTQKMRLFIFENNFEQVTSNTQFWLSHEGGRFHPHYVASLSQCYIIIQICCYSFRWWDLTSRKSTENVMMKLSTVLHLWGKIAPHFSHIFMIWCLISKFNLFLIQ